MPDSCVPNHITGTNTTCSHRGGGSRCYRRWRRVTVGDVLDGVAPLSGGAYSRTREVSGTVESPYGSATVRYDDAHRPSISADSQQAACYAVGYVQAADRLFELDLLRRRAQGRLAEAFGPPLVESDVRNSKLDFRTAARVTREQLAGTETERVLAAYADGVSTYIESEPPGVEFGVLDYQPEPWSVTDTLSITKWVAWRFGGGTSLRPCLYRRRFDSDKYATLFPQQLPGRPPAIRGDARATEDVAGARAPPAGGDLNSVDGGTLGSRTADDGDGATGATDDGDPLDPAFVEWATGSDPPQQLGSNAWVVSGEYTESGSAVVCSEPHVQLQASPFWYEQRVETPDRTVEGVALPSTPVVAIGGNDGSPTSDAYTDQLSLWAKGEYRTPERPSGDPAISFRGSDG